MADHIFISYAREDQIYARKLRDELNRRGFEVWIDDRIDFGDRWWQTIVQAIRNSAAFVVVMTPDSEKSEWVERELLLAQRLRKPIFPLLLRGHEFPLLITTQYVDVTNGQLPPELFYKKLGWIAPPKPQEEKKAPERPQPVPRHISGGLLAGVGISLLVVIIGIVTWAVLTWLSGNGNGEEIDTRATLIALAATATAQAQAEAGQPLPIATDTPTSRPSPTHTPEPPTNTPVPSTNTPTPVPDDLPQILSPRQPFEPEMILIPAGEFLMGSDLNVDKDAQEDEQPQHTLYLPDFYIAKTEVTNAQYEAFVQATGHEPPAHWQNGQPPSDKPDHPVVYVSWHDAVAYCKWLSEVSGRIYRLPTEAEWEKAARGTDGRIYPWGNQWDKSLTNTFQAGPEGTAPVGAYPAGASPYGLLDMAGNVWEWCATRWDKSYPYDAEENEWSPGYLEGNERRVLRGGSWISSRSYARCAYRNDFFPYFRSYGWGLRLVSPIS